MQFAKWTRGLIINLSTLEASAVCEVNMHLLESLCSPLDQQRNQCIFRKTHLLQAHWVAGSKCALRRRSKCIFRSRYFAIRVSRISDSFASSQSNVRNVHITVCFHMLFAKRICFPRPNAAKGDTRLTPRELLFAKCTCFRHIHFCSHLQGSKCIFRKALLAFVFQLFSHFCAPSQMHRQSSAATMYS